MSLSDDRGILDSFKKTMLELELEETLTPTNSGNQAPRPLGTAASRVSCSERHWNVARDRSDTTPKEYLVAGSLRVRVSSANRKQQQTRFLDAPAESFCAQLADRAGRTDGLKLPVNALVYNRLPVHPGREDPPG